MLTILSLSCDKEKSEDPKPEDVREQAVGNYKGEFEVLDLSDPTVSYPKIAVSLTVQKNTSNTSSIDIKSEEGDVIKGIKIAKASNGFTFDIESQEVNVDGDPEKETIKGENFFELAGTKYHGFYKSKTKEFFFAYSTKMNIDLDKDGVAEEAEVLIGISAKKQ